MLVLLCACNSGGAAGNGGSAGGVGAAGGRGGGGAWGGAGGSTCGWAASGGWGGVGGARPWAGGGVGVAGFGGLGGWVGAGGWAGAGHWGGAWGVGAAGGWGGSGGSLGAAGLGIGGDGYNCDFPFLQGLAGQPRGQASLYCGSQGPICEDAQVQELLCCTPAGGCGLQLGNTCVPNDDKSGWPPHNLGSACPPATLNFDWLGNCAMAGCCRRDGSCGLLAPYSWGVCVDRVHFADRGLQPICCNPAP
ncbi:MAG: hypothetical protein MJD61_21400 [Proteobacteria bacterium]|nr:hypothetical protein [Pseudomonadota bacterium]